MARSVHFLTFGQSYAQRGYSRSYAYWTFAEALRRVITSNPSDVGSSLGVSIAASDMVQLHQTAVDGSAILQANDAGNGHWVTNANGAGPLLTAATGAIAGYATKPQFAIWSHGEADVRSSGMAISAVQTAVTARLFPDIRSACNSGAPSDVRIFVDMLGFRYAEDEAREAEMRDMMLGLVVSQTNVFRGAEKYAVELDSSLHPTQLGYLTLGAHTGRKVASRLAFNSELESPSIASASRSGNSVTVSISVPSGGTLVKPAHPAHFGLYDAGGVRLPYSASWSGDIVTLTCPSQPATLRYPAREARFDASRIIRLSNPTDPIFPGEPGLPLQSRLPISL